MESASYDRFRRAMGIGALAVSVLGVGILARSDAPVPPGGSAIEKRGCCSHHKGVCGCDKGRAVCCDGQYSPTCGC